MKGENVTATSRQKSNSGAAACTDGGDGDTPAGREREREGDGTKVLLCTIGVLQPETCKRASEGYVDTWHAQALWSEVRTVWGLSDGCALEGIQANGRHRLSELSQSILWASSMLERF